MTSIERVPTLPESESGTTPVFSLVVPVFNEVECLSELVQRVTVTMDGLDEPWEIVLVDDGSQDGSAESISTMATQDDRLVLVAFVRNFGHQAALTAGLDRARGQAVIILDADLQDPPEVIPEMVDRWREGFEIVYGVRTERRSESRFKLLSASLFYRLMRRLTDLDIPLDSGDFRLLDRSVVDVLTDMREHHRFLRGMTAWTGFRQVGVGYAREPRFAGSTKYPLKKMLWLAITAVSSFSFQPLRLATLVGFAAAAISIISIPLVLIARIAGIEGLGGQTTVLITVLFLGGVQLISLGVLGEYVGRIYDETRGRPLYLIRQASHRPTPSHNEQTESSQREAGEEDAEIVRGV